MIRFARHGVNGMLIWWDLHVGQTSSPASMQENSMFLNNFEQL